MRSRSFLRGTFPAEETKRALGVLDAYTTGAERIDAGPEVA